MILKDRVLLPHGEGDGKQRTEDRSGERQCQPENDRDMKDPLHNLRTQHGGQQ